jgi:hypothetical protein
LALTKGSMTAVGTTAPVAPTREDLFGGNFRRVFFSVAAESDVSQARSLRTVSAATVSAATVRNIQLF